MVYKQKNKKVIVAMSGGVDSSTTAFLLKEQGYEVIGIFIKLTDSQAKSENAARAVCQQLGIKFYPINLAAKFRNEIINYFINSYAKGLTPNPCIKCNQVIKFSELLRLRKELGADYLATGHYACLRQEIINSKLQIPKYKLYQGKDENKDQSYFLYTLTQAQLAYTLFPLGEYAKKQIRAIADKEKLPYLIQESQDVCFLNKDGQIVDHNEFLKKNIKLKKGPIKIYPHLQPLSHCVPCGRGGVKKKRVKKVTSPEKYELEGAKKVREGGKKIGEHQGLPLYTIGQRKGVEIGGIGPFYVAKADYKTNTLYVVKDGNDPALYKDELTVGEVNWVAGVEPKLPLKCEAVIRYRHKPVECKVIKSKVKSGGIYQVIFREPQRAITPGQSVVFYRIRRRVTNAAHTNDNEEEVLGGGVIK